MKRRKFKQEKLWRDKIVLKAELEDAKLHINILDDKEFDYQLRRKLCEEAEEVLETTSQEELIDEIGDVLEVIDALCELHGISRIDIKEQQDYKRAERGNYAGRQFVTAVEYPVGSYGEECCLAEPERYPEIIDTSD